jgi:Short C-terminal domain
MGMIRRRTRRRTMLVAGGAAYAAGRAGRGGQDDYADEQDVPPAPPPPAPTAAESEADEIQNLVELHASGALTDEEFAAAKAKALGI